MDSWEQGIKIRFLERRLAKCVHILTEKDKEIERLRARLLDTSEDQGEYNDIQEVSVKDSVTAD